MEVFKNKDWKIEKVNIPQTQGSSKEEFFVDDHTGKNWAVCKSLDEAMKWINDQGPYENKKTDDATELRDIACYFEACGKKHNGAFLRKIAMKLEKLNNGG